MSVVDASVIAAIVLREESWDKLIAHLRGAITLDQAFKEALNAIWKAIRRGYLNRDDALKAFKILESIMESIEVRSELNYLDKAFELSVETDLSIYDSLYLALAQSERRPLLTLDKTQKKLARKLSIPIKEL